MADPKIAIDLTLKNEGGFQCLENDRGNWTGGEVGGGKLVGTKYGISAFEFPDLDIPNLTIEQAIQIYEKKYWAPLYSQITEQAVANKLFDAGVFQGQGTAVKILQKVLEPQFGLVVDCNFGPKTLEAVNQSEPLSLLMAYKTALVAHVVQVATNNPHDRPYVADWVRRINS